MGKIDMFAINFDKPNPYYFGGETLSGRVIIRCRERMKINDVHIDIISCSDVHWTETRSRSNGKSTTTYTVHYTSHEDYLNLSIMFLSKQQKISEECYLEFGEHTFTFQVVLPQTLPPSFQHPIGKIRHFIRGTVNIPWSLNKYTMRSFALINLLDLNLNSMLKIGNEAEGTKTLCCGPCRSAPIIGRLRTTKTGFVPGELINFNASLRNQSNKPIKVCAVKLIQYLSFTARHFSEKTKSEFRDVAVIYCPQPIGPNDFYEWNGLLQIPPVCSTLNNMTSVVRNIQIEYFLSLYFDVTTFSMSTNLKVPIVIGTVPLSTEDNQMRENGLPTYENCMYGPCEAQTPPADNPYSKGEILDNDENTFKPIYPYFKFN